MTNAHTQIIIILSVLKRPSTLECWEPLTTPWDSSVPLRIRELRSYQLGLWTWEDLPAWPRWTRATWSMGQRIRCREIQCQDRRNRPARKLFYSRLQEKLYQQQFFRHYKPRLVVRLASPVCSCGKRERPSSPSIGWSAHDSEWRKWFGTVFFPSGSWRQRELSHSRLQREVLM